MQGRRQKAEEFQSFYFIKGRLNGRKIIKKITPKKSNTLKSPL